jgi:hypothetical protein
MSEAEEHDSGKELLRQIMKPLQPLLSATIWGLAGYYVGSRSSMGWNPSSGAGCVRVSCDIRRIDSPVLNPLHVFP